MPYIKQEKRPEIDALLNPLIKYLENTKMEEQDAAFDYIITKTMKHLYTGHFFNFNRGIGVLSSVSAEFYRHVISPYEEEKIKENGDVE